MDEDRARYIDIEQMVKCQLRDAEKVYVNDILQNGISALSLKSNGNVITDSLSNA